MGLCFPDRVLQNKALETLNAPGEAKSMLIEKSARVGASSAGVMQSASGMPPTDVSNPDYFHKVVDCQWACPAHTPVPEYIRLIAARRFGEAWNVNWKSNV